MIRYWKLSHFKSFRNPPAIRLSSVNVIAGANSSGKSTIIQSILLLKQTLQYGATNRPLVLNGPLLRLGAFADIKHLGSSLSNLSIEFELDVTDSHRQQGTNPWSKTLRRPHQGLEAPRYISSRLEFNIDDPKEYYTPLSGQITLNPKLVSMYLGSSADSSESSEIVNYVTYRSTSDPDPSLMGAQYEVDMDSESSADVCGRKPEARVVGGFVSHFLPMWSVVKYNETAHHALQLSDAILSDGLFNPFPGGEGEIISEKAVIVANHWLSKHGHTPLVDYQDGVSAKDLRDAFQPIVRRTKGSIFGLTLGANNEVVEHNDLTELRNDFFKALVDSQAEVIEDVDLELPKSTAMSVRYLTEYFKSGIKYLGPLRDSPRPVYQPEALESTVDVGYRGEHTAAVLDLNGHKPIWHHLPPNEESVGDYFGSAVRRRTTLVQAVQRWLQYLGVAQEVQTFDAGVYGNRLQVTTSDTDQRHDLTNVGVGVSQVLPIVVMALLAQPGTLLIFEQPELHLHPKVQARLADFFLSLAKDGKQTVLETHSEYLVDRLRLRIALSEGDETSNAINILFSKKSKGETILTPIEVNEYGAVINWPEDFFEQSQNDVSRILKAAAAKRKLKMNAR